MASYEKRGSTWRYRISLGKDVKTGKYKYISNSVLNANQTLNITLKW